MKNYFQRQQFCRLLAVSFQTDRTTALNVQESPCAMWLLIAKVGISDVWTCSLVALLWLCKGCCFGCGWLIEADWLYGWVTWCCLWLLKSPMGTWVSSEWRVDVFFQLARWPQVSTVWVWMSEPSLYNYLETLHVDITVAQTQVVFSHIMDWLGWLDNGYIYFDMTFHRL